MEAAFEGMADAHVNAYAARIRDLLLNIMMYAEAELSSAAALTTPTNRIEDENDRQLLVSSFTVNNVWVLQNLTENVTVPELEDRWRGQMIGSGTIIENNENVNEDYRTTFRLAEDIIVIRYIMDFRQPENGVQYSTQIIWNSRFSWHQILQHLQESTYNFNFKPEIMTVMMNYLREEEEVVSRSRNPAEVVDGLPDVIIRLEDNVGGDEVICAICYEMFNNGETAKLIIHTASSPGLIIKSRVPHADMSHFLPDDELPVLLLFIS